MFLELYFLETYLPRIHSLCEHPSVFVANKAISLLVQILSVTSLESKTYTSNLQSVLSEAQKVLNCENVDDLKRRKTYLRLTTQLIETCEVNQWQNIDAQFNLTGACVKLLLAGSHDMQQVLEPLSAALEKG